MLDHTHTSKIRTAWFVGMAAMGVVLLTGEGRGQLDDYIVLVSPTESAMFPETREFSTTEVGRPWDMNDIRDIPFDINFQEPSVLNGVWTGVSLNTAPALSPLFRGYSTPWYTQHPSWYDKGMPYGQLNPINAGRYTRLSMRMRIPEDKRSAVFLYWTKDYRHDEYGVLEGLPEPPHYMGFADGENSHTYFHPNSSDFRIYDLDLTGQNFFNEQNTRMFDSLVYKGSWDGTIYGMLIQPSMNAPVGTPVDFDWLRLYDAAAGPDLVVRWETPYLQNSDDYYVRVYLDSDDKGYDGDLFISGLVNDGSYRLHTGALPPGTYYLYLELMFRGVETTYPLGCSGYSAPITVQAAPLLEFTAPSMTSGTDYASADLGIPWDMSGPACIKTNLQMAPPAFSEGILTSTALPQVPGQEADPMLFLNTRAGGRNVPIDTTAYRYLTFSMKVEPAGYTNIQDWIFRGWVARLVWGGSDYLDVDGSYSKSICLLEDWHHYSVDLWDPGLLEDDPALTTVAQAGWTNIRFSTFFRFDPLEVFTPTVFHLDDMKLCAMSQTRNGAFRIAWTSSDADSRTLTTTLFVGQTNAAGVYTENPAPIGEVTHAANGATSFLWTVAADLPSGDYLVRAQTTDGVNTCSRLAAVPLRVIQNPQPVTPDLIWGKPWGWPGAIPVSGDYDGDGLYDLAVFDSNTGCWYITRHDGEILCWGQAWGWPGAEPVPGDYNGDGKADLAVFDQNTGYWFVRTVASGEIIQWAFPWGWPGAKPVPGDYDNDAKSDFCVFDTIQGDWYMVPSGSHDTIWGKPWGWPGAIPVSGDYDGDSLYDLAVFDSNTGCWFVTTARDVVLVWARPWGWPGAEPVPGDYNGDGQSDLAVFDQNTGYWYILTAGNELLAWAIPWGWPGARPVSGHYVGDTCDDLAVFDSNTGYWYVRPMIME